MFFISVSIGFAQTIDSIPQKTIAYATDKFPTTRVFNVEYSHLSPYKFSPELDEVSLPKNKVESSSQLKAIANFYFIKKQKWTLITTLNYRYISMNTENSTPVFPAENHSKGNFHYHSEALTLTYFSKLFNKMAIYSATVSVDGSQERFERIRGMLTGTIVLKANAQTKMTLGLAVMIDPSVQVPAIPIFSYEHKFKNGWVADVILPKKAIMRKDVFENGRISFGSEMENTSFYLYNSNKTYEFRQLEINSGVIYEHKISDAFIGTFKTGLKVFANSRIFEKNESFNDYFFDAKSKPAFYFNLGISYNPFVKTAKKR